MAYQIQPILFRNILEEIVQNNITNYTNKRDADNLLLNTDQDNDAILERIQDYTDKIDKLQKFVTRTEAFYGTALDREYSTALFLKQLLKRCAEEYDEDYTKVDNFYGDIVLLALEEYLQMRARDTSSIKPSTKIVNMLVSRSSTLSFSGSEAASKYTIVSQNPEIATVTRDSQNPWNMTIQGIHFGTTNIIIEDTINQLSISVPVVILPSTLNVPLDVQMIETHSVSFPLASNISPIHVSGLIQNSDGTYSEEMIDGEHPFPNIEMSREGDTLTVKGLHYGQETINVSIYDKSLNIKVHVIKPTIEPNIQKVQIRKGSYVNIAIRTDVDLTISTKYEVNNNFLTVKTTNIVNSNNGTKTYNMYISGARTGVAKLLVSGGSQTIEIPVTITERT